MAITEIQIKRIYEVAAQEDGLRCLVDRLWPRGISKARAQLNDWPVFLAPSSALRRWYHQDQNRWPEFRKAYRAELEMKSEEIEYYLKQKVHGKLTLVYASNSDHQNHALVLEAYLKELVHRKSLIDRAIS